MGNGIIKSIYCVVLSIAIICTNVSAEAVGGEDIDPVEGETIFKLIEHTKNTADLENWEITLTLSDEAASNGTTFTVTTQICNNEGNCFPPEERPLSTDDNITFTSYVKTIDDHSYVNWRITASYDNDDTEKFPSSGFYKTWSNCWFHKDVWGGDGCDTSSSETEKLPAITALATLGTVMIAAAFIRD